jgi:hypothetical protein
MHIEVLDEPELEFGGARRHVDPRFGINAYGPADIGQDGVPTTIRLGLVGPRDQLDGIRRWIDRCRGPIDAKDSGYPHLFPAFPGCESDTGLCTTLTIADRNCRELPSRELDRASSLPGELAVRAMVDVYMGELEALTEGNRVDVIIVARPDTLDDVHLAEQAGDEAGTARSPARRAGSNSPPLAVNFHDLLKARALRLGIPLQILRRSTWDESAPPPPRRSRQDEATRAWNLHVALYYKAGGIPWRLQRASTDLPTCYVGISFYRSAASGALETAVAHIFNERGDRPRGDRPGQQRGPPAAPARRRRPGLAVRRPGRLQARAPHPARPACHPQVIPVHRRRERRVHLRSRRAGPARPGPDLDH